MGYKSSVMHISRPIGKYFNQPKAEQSKSPENEKFHLSEVDIGRNKTYAILGTASTNVTFILFVSITR